MTDYTKLVEALRHLSTGRCDDLHGCEPCAIYETCLTRCILDAASAIEALQAELSKRDDGCDVCRNGNLEEGDTLYKSSDWDGGIGFDYIRDIRFCPICGRKMEAQE